MKFIHRSDKKTFIFYAVLFLLVCTAAFIPDVSQAFNLFPGEQASIQDYRLFIQNFYRFSIAAGILIATVLIMIGGVIWITSAGDQGRIGKAKEYIINSIIGVVLLMGAYVILAVINPNLVELQKVETEDLGSWQECADGSVIEKGQQCPATSKPEKKSACDNASIKFSKTTSNIADQCFNWCKGKQTNDKECGSRRLVEITNQYNCICGEGAGKASLADPKPEDKGACMKGQDTTTCTDSGSSDVTREKCEQKTGYSFHPNSSCRDFEIREETGACTYEVEEPGLIYGTNIVKKCEDLSKSDCTQHAGSTFKSGETCAGEGIQTQYVCSRSTQYVQSTAGRFNSGDCRAACEAINCQWTGADPNETAAGLLTCHCESKI